MSTIDSTNPAKAATGQALQVTIHPQTPFWSSDTPSFKDFLDVVNPLQHIPIVSNIYQSLTGDTQSQGSKIAGGTLFGGPIGFITSLIDSIVQGETGKDIGGNIMAAVNGEGVKTPSSSEQAVASSIPGAPSPTNTSAYAAYIQTHNLIG